MPCLNWHGDFIVHFSINISSHPQLMRSMVSSTRKISAPFSSSSFPAVMATPMTAPSSAQGAGETGGGRPSCGQTPLFTLLHRSGSFGYLRCARAV